ncbi:hypothetical protein BESB_039560 [Besnoitia besnoiti]|uniref:Uncharacterized protein n=1 Tax=Besnoitia besnoiti TaxID=94643 RepID=A0A2A9MG64_BESBE|nr:hypothetical protein BESB_039560 [Besnoitia besnoiti]PFH37498.1 hypothetical protein BESB_039560 [Besnoitia besnoiti]
MDDSKSELDAISQMPVEDIHKHLQSLPRAAWAVAIAQLPVEKKKELRRLLSRKNVEKSKTPSQTSAAASPAANLSPPKSRRQAFAEARGVCTRHIPPSEAVSRTPKIAPFPPGRPEAGGVDTSASRQGTSQGGCAAGLGGVRTPEAPDALGQYATLSPRDGAAAGLQDASLSSEDSSSLSRAEPLREASAEANREEEKTVNGEADTPGVQLTQGMKAARGFEAKKAREKGANAWERLDGNTHPYGIPALPLSAFLPLLSPPAWAMPISRFSQLSASVSSALLAGRPSRSVPPAACASRADPAFSAEARESAAALFFSFRDLLAVNLLHPAYSPVAHLFRPLEELAFVTGCLPSLCEEEKGDVLLRRSLAPPISPATRVLVLYLHCWLTLLLRAYHADTVYAYCACGSRPPAETPPARRDAEEPQPEHLRSLFDAPRETAEDEDEELPSSRRVRDLFTPPPARCRGCAAVTKRMTGTANWRRFFERYFPTAVARFASVASARQSAARAMASSCSLQISLSPLSSGALPSPSSSSSLHFALLPLPLRPRHQEVVEDPLYDWTIWSPTNGVAASPTVVSSPHAPGRRETPAPGPDECEKSALFASSSGLQDAGEEGSASAPPTEKSALAAEAARCLLEPAKRFEDRLNLLHVRSCSLRGADYKRFVDARTRQLLKKTLQSLPFRVSLAQLASHIWGFKAGAAKGSSSGRPADEERDDEEGAKVDENEDDANRGKVGGILPGGPITQLFLFIVSDRLQTCAELALRCMYTWRERARERGTRRREAEEKSESRGDAAQEEEASPRQDGEEGRRSADAALFAAPNFRQSADAQRALLPLSAVARLLGSEASSSGDSADVERAEAAACAADLLFHCVDQPLFNVCGSFPLFSAAPACVDLYSKKLKHHRASLSSASATPDSSRGASGGVKGEIASHERKGRQGASRETEDHNPSREPTAVAGERDASASETPASASGGSDPHGEPATLWAALVDAAVDFCVRSEGPGGAVRRGAARSASSRTKRGQRGKRRRASEDEEEAKRESEEGRWRMPGIDLCGAFVAVRVQQLWTASAGKGDCREMVAQAMREWRATGAALAGADAAAAGVKGGREGDGETDSKAPTGNACAQSVSLLVSLHQQLREMYEHMAAASKMAALLTLLHSSSPALLPQAPRYLNLRELIDVNHVLHTQAGTLSEKAARFHARQARRGAARNGRTQPAQVKREAEDKRDAEDKDAAAVTSAVEDTSEAYGERRAPGRQEAEAPQDGDSRDGACEAADEEREESVRGREDERQNDRQALGVDREGDAGTGKRRRGSEGMRQEKGESARRRTTAGRTKAA